MELVDVLDNRNEYTGSIKGRKELSEGEFRNLVHIWIINSKGEFLLQKRSNLKKHFPNKWSVTRGCTLSKESLVETCRRECKEEFAYCIRWKRRNRRSSKVQGMEYTGNIDIGPLRFCGREDLF